MKRKGSKKHKVHFHKAFVLYTASCFNQSQLESIVRVIISQYTKDGVSGMKEINIARAILNRRKSERIAAPRCSLQHLPA